MQETKDVYKLTNPQKNIWNLEQFYKGTAINNICGSVFIKQETDLDILAQAINKFIENNDSFRTRIQLINGEPHQYFIENKIYKFETIKFNNIENFRAYAKREAQIPFEVINSQLFTFKLFKLPNKFGGFIINAHHIISDAATFAMIGSEIISNYIHIKNNEDIPTKEYSYKTYIESEQKYLKSNRFEKDKAYWNSLYENIPEVATIPSSKLNSTSENELNIAANRIEFIFDNTLLNKINSYCKANKISLYNFLVAIYSIYISKINNIENFSIGTPILNRSNYAEKHTSGMFISTSLLQINMQNNPTVNELIHRIAQTSMAMLKHQKYDYQYILSDVRKSIPSINQLYDIALSYQITKATDATLAIPYESTWYATPYISNGIDIHFHDNNDQGNLLVEYDYQICKFDKKDILNMHNRIMCIISQILNNSYIHYDEIEILTPEEKHKITCNFNNYQLEYNKNETIVDMFERQVKQTPNNTAVVFQNSQLTYKQLNEKSNSFANFLLQNGMQKGSIVPVIMNRSTNLIIAMLSIIKLGATYLPISPDTPINRINFILKNSKAKFAIVNNKNFTNSNIKIININNVNFKEYNSQNLELPISASDLLYIIYTSGSTGQPKGVQVCHNNLINFIHSFTKLYGGISNADKLLASTNISFDVSIFEIFMPILNGATLYLYDEPHISDIYKYCNSIVENKITFAYIPPNILEIVYKILAESSNLCLNKLLLGVEPIKAELVNKYYSLNPNFKIINAYGPTETTICATAILLNKTILKKYTTIPIGHPLHNLKIYILDESQNPVPIGVPGEIYISGKNVSMGYLENSELTNKSFIELPNLNCKLAYKTGDLAKWDENGLINFIGRNDNQVKINGHRIELAEIEHCVLSHPYITKAVVLVNEGKKIVCYYTTSQKIKAEELKTYLKSRLPSYSIPSFFMEVDSFSLTPNGKINKSKLPKVNIENNKSSIILPTNDTEQQLLNIISQLLNFKNISINDNLFNIGGDSLFAINLSVQIQDRLHIQLFVKDIMEHPTIQDLSNLIKSKTVSKAQSILTVPESDFYATSSAQKRIYFASKLDNNNSILYNISGGIVLDKKIDTLKLEKCLQLLINRHESLRTYFEMKNNTVVQRILNKFEFKLDILENAQIQDLDKIFHKFVKPFNLNKAPLFRATYITFTNGKSALLIDTHHIVSDGRSLEIFVDELCKLYNGESLPTINITYKDYAYFEKNELISDNLREAKNYWINQFKDNIPVLNMPTNNLRPALRSYEGNKIHAIIDEKTTKKIKIIAQKLNITPYMLLLSVYYILLAKYTSQDDIVIGSPISARTITQTDNLIGMFVNTLAIRHQVNQNLNFESFAKSLKENILNAYKYQSYPFDELVNNLNIKTDTSRNPLFDTMFTFQNNGFKKLHLKDINANYYIPDSKVAKFDLSVEAIPDNNKINLSFEYATSLFNKDFIKNFAKHYINILHLVLDNANIQISNINMLSPEEKHKIIYNFNNYQLEYNKNETIVDMFERQVKQTPNNTAVVFQNSQLTYKQLNEKSNSFANFLLQNGMQKGSIVPVIMNRSTNLIIAMLSIIKLGATYLPISPDTPINRINFILKNSKAKFAIVNNKNFTNSNIKIININNVNFKEYNSQNLELPISASDLLYIIYTSGSTGQPKGVQVCHNNLINFIHSFTKLYGGISNADKLLASTNISFDVSIFEIFMPILNGATLYLYDEPHISDIYKYCNSIVENKITFAYIPPNILEIVYKILAESSNLCLNKLLLGVEPIKAELVNKYYSLNPNFKIINAYGPTETTICATAILLNKTILKKYTTIPIGHPLHNLKIYILDESQNPVPIGVPGEIYISGKNVSMGYLENSELTNKSFIELPNLNCKLAYKTGDLAKWDENGLINFIGRNDNQVKINGHRIELAEIEHCVLSHPYITKAVVLVNEGKKIVCYYTTSQKIKAEELKTYLKSRLPSYSIPSFFMEVDSFSLTPNGKIDKKKLISLKPTYIDIKNFPPRNNTDLKLINICQKLLGVETISIEENLFELGGDSLFAINLCVQIKEFFNIQLFAKDIFEHSTIKELSDIIEKDVSTEKIATIPSIKQAEFYDVSSAQKRIYFASKLAGNDSTLYNIAGGVILSKTLDTLKLENCIQQIINRHEAFKTYFTIENAKVKQKLKNDVSFKLDIVSNADFENIDIIFKEFVQPFNLEYAPLFRVKFIQFTNNKSAIFINMHHIISDGTSMNIIIDELSKLYNNQPLPDINITYKDFSAYENYELSSGKYNEAKKYWINQFKNEAPVLNMPTKHQRPAVQSYEGNIIHSIINEDTTKKIKKLSESLGITPYMFLLSCYYILLSKYTSQEDIVVGTPIANRTLPQTASLVGMFVNTLALRNSINHKLTFKEFALNIKENILSAYKYQYYPYDELVDTLNIKRDTSRNPLFDTMFIYQNNGLKNIHFNDIEAKYYIADMQTSKFDLSVEIMPKNNTMNLSFEYSTKLFDEIFIKNMCSNYLTLIQNVLKNCNAQISDIDMLSNEEKNKILYNFNDTAMSYNERKTIVDLFEEQVQKTPNNIAIAFENQELTYKELNERANSLAYYLRSNSQVINNTPVGIMVNRSLEMIVAILAVLKSGGAYIPIDPTFPKNRIDYMLKNSNCKILLTQEKLQSKIDYENILLIDLDKAKIYNSHIENLNNINKPDDLAYIIFTSGSTGNPKGVMITHKVLSNFTNYCNNYVKYLKKPKYQSIVSITTISFDIFFYETIISLQKGLKVVIANETEQNTPHILNKLLKKHEIKIIQATPSRMQIFINNINAMPSLSELEYIILAGEQLPLNLVQDIHNLSEITIYNGYGPSETYYSTLVEVQDDLVTIGKPIYNTQMYILDKHLKPVPIGVCGEIYISGYAVGKGYLNNKDLTKKSFIKNPFLPNNTMYKTGDLGMYLEDGNILCLGRVDHQIKIRGLRIELEEIEAVIKKYPNIKKVAVIKQVINNREFISGYYVASKVINKPALKQYLSKILPKYMIPSYFVALDDLPYTPNGKIDRKALPLPTEILSINTKNYVAPKTDLQKQIVNIFESVLNTSPIGINDNFFELGGDSLLAMNLTIELLKLSSKIIYQDIFRFPTVSELEEKINSDEDKLIFSKIENLSDNIVDVLNSCTKKAKIIKKHPKGILLTGGTGFLGIHIVEEFIKKEKGNIYCIIRNVPGITSRARLHQKLNYYFGNKYDDLIDKRIFAVTGDILKPGFGLNQDELLQVVNSIDIVVHSAAIVSHYGNYNAFYNTNVKSVKYLIDFCKSFNKKLYHISTIGVAGTELDLLCLSDNSKDKKVQFDESKFYIGQILDNYYTRTKFEAESYILNAISEGLDAYIMRMGHLTPRYKDGIFQENILDNDLIIKTISFIKIGVVPDYLLDLPLEFTPVDSASKSIIKLITHPSGKNRIFHLYNHKIITVKKLIRSVQKQGFKVSIISEKEFKYKIKKILNDEGSKNILNNLINDFNNDLHLHYKTDIIIKSDFTINYLKRLFFRWPKISNKYLKRFIELLRSVM